MNAHDTALSIAVAIVTAGKEALEPVHVYAHDVEVLPDGSQQLHVVDILLPAVFVRARLEALAGSANIGKGTVEIVVESQSDDETSEVHSARETAVRDVLADVGQVVSGFDAVGTVQLMGRPCLVENDPDTEDRAFRTPMTYKVGVNVL